MHFIGDLTSFLSSDNAWPLTSIFNTTSLPNAYNKNATGRGPILRKRATSTRDNRQAGMTTLRQRPIGPGIRLWRAVAGGAEA